MPVRRPLELLELPKESGHAGGRAPGIELHHADSAREGHQELQGKDGLAFGRVLGKDAVRPFPFGAGEAATGGREGYP